MENIPESYISDRYPACPEYKTKLYEIGAIQDVGYIISVSFVPKESHYIVTNISENITNASWVKTGLLGLLKKPVEEVFTGVISDTVIGLIDRFKSVQKGYGIENNGSSKTLNALPRLLCKGIKVKYEDKMICISVVEAKNTDNCYIVEFEEIDEPLNSDLPHNKIMIAGNILARMRATTSFETAVASFVDSVMELLPTYDRGMVYRFCDDDAGDVIYEKLKNPEILQSSYLHLRFPECDIPAQARQLFKINGIRFINNVDGATSKILGADNTPLNLTLSSFRAVHPCHLEYLHNMGVKATLVVAIVVEDRLWGLNCFHSYTEVAHPTVEDRTLVEMLGSINSMRLYSFLLEANNNRKLAINRLFYSLQNNTNVKEFLHKNSSTLLEIVEADTFIMYFQDGRRLVYGDQSMLPKEVGYDKLNSMSKTNTLMAINTFTEGLSRFGAGVIFYRQQSVTLLFLRRNKICEMRWAGKTDISIDPTSRLCPRASFEEYVEKTHVDSKNWTTTDCELAQYVFDQIIQYLHSDMLTTFRMSLDQSAAECTQVIQSSKENYEFFAHMSHELRTPFHGVISSLQILQSSGNSLDPGERKDIIDSALDCGKVMLRTLDDILTIAKNKNNIEVAKAPFFIKKVFDTTTKLMLPMAECRSINLWANVVNVNVRDQQLSQSDFQSVVVVGDETRIGQISNNLTNNAIKFTPEGGSVSINSSILSNAKEVMDLWVKDSKPFANKYVYDKSFKTEISSKDAYFTYSVRDTGCGIPATDLSTVFNAYKQVASTVQSKSYQGTGLGLHIVQLHIDSMKGVLAVASTPQQGTIFFFAIPLEVSSEPQEVPIDLVPTRTTTKRKATLVAEKGNNGGGGDTGNKKRIRTGAQFLIVDDSQINLRLAKRKVELALGNEVTVILAEDGLEAITTYQKLIDDGKQHNLCGIFMDYHMPRCSGRDSIIGIRAIEAENPHLRPVHIIAFTADLSEQSQQELIVAGANEVMAKPTPAGQLEEACVKLAS